MSEFADRPQPEDAEQAPETRPDPAQAPAEARGGERPSAEHDAPGEAFSGGRTLVVALRGWNDAGDAASDAAIFLRRVLADTSELLWTCDDENFFDYSLHRPIVQGAGGDRQIVWPGVTVTGPKGEADRGEELASDAQLRVSGGNRDLFVLTGIEPTLRWRSFAEGVIRFVDEHAIGRIVLVGALLNDSPHSRPVTVYATSDDAAVREELGVGRSEYEGPTGMLGVLSDAVRRRDDLTALSLWAAVPHYAHASPSPKATSALLDKLEEVLDISLPHAELLEQAQRWEAEIDEMAASDEDIAEYVQVLEQTYDMVEAPEASGEAIAKEFERFLEQSSKSAAASKPLRRPDRRRRPPAASAEDEQGAPDDERPDLEAAPEQASGQAGEEGPDVERPEAER